MPKYQSVSELYKYNDYNLLKEGPFNNHYYLVRHGESEANVERILSNEISSHHKLTERGIVQARSTGERLAALQLPQEKTLLFSSPLLRAAQTASHIAERLGIRPQFSTNLRERHYGQWEGTKITPEKVTTLAVLDHEYPFHTFQNIESLMNLTQRITAQIMHFESIYTGYNIILVSHYNTITMALNAVERVWPGRELPIEHVKIYPLSQRRVQPVLHYGVFAQPMGQSAATLAICNFKSHL